MTNDERRMARHLVTLSPCHKYESTTYDLKQDHNMGSLKRTSVGTGTHWEALAGYARAVRVGERILVSGTTATGPDGVVGAGDVAAQARYIIDKIEAAISQLGGSLR